jgi:hypothetical protein
MKNKSKITNKEKKIIKVRKGNNFQYLRRSSIARQNSNLMISDKI